MLIPFSVGQVVEVIDGPFKEFSGTVQEIDHDKGKVKVEVACSGAPPRSTRLHAAPRLLIRPSDSTDY